MTIPKSYTHMVSLSRNACLHIRREDSDTTLCGIKLTSNWGKYVSALVWENNEKYRCASCEKNKPADATLWRIGA